MGNSPSNLVGPFDVSAHISPRREPDDGVTRVQANCVGAAQSNLSSVADRISNEQAYTAASPRVGIPEDDKIVKLDPNIVPAYSPAIPGLPLVNVSMSVPNSGSRRPDRWMPTPLLRRPRDPLSSRTKFLLASATAVLLSGYFVLRNSDRPDDVAMAPQSKSDLSPIASLPL